jgi:hypothetical protein
MWLWSIDYWSILTMVSFARLADGRLIPARPKCVNLFRVEFHLSRRIGPGVNGSSNPTCEGPESTPDMQRDYHCPNPA